MEKIINTHENQYLSAINLKKERARNHTATVTRAGRQTHSTITFGRNSQSVPYEK